MVDLAKIRNKKTGLIHASDTGITPICREIKRSALLLFEDAGHNKVNCKNCLKLLEILFLDEERDERLGEIMCQTFIPYDDNHGFNRI